MNGSEPNRIVGNCLVHGTFFVSGNYRNEYGEWDSCSLTDEQIEKYTAMFENPIIVLENAIDEDFEESEELDLTMQ